MPQGNFKLKKIKAIQSAAKADQIPGLVKRININGSKPSCKRKNCPAMKKKQSTTNKHVKNKLTCEINAAIEDELVRKVTSLDHNGLSLVKTSDFHSTSNS
ncbi:hypothetical protein GJ496_009037 [Pomphorhynchus laevis]|nr:hypothetical protein GJ496_009037 [Pomphorhynchus laevis]